MSEPVIELRNISKAYAAHPVLRNINLQVWAGEFLTLLGPSGCGKTTILRLLAGFEKPDGGEIRIAGQLPLLMPAVAAGWLLSFTLSMDDVMVSFFVTGPTFEILPLRIYSIARLGVTQEINALCTIMLGVTLVLILIAQLLLRERA
jgi:ABC-type branched-subunit amino acid transport system ATPase component